MPGAAISTPSVEFDDDPDPPEVVCYCGDCAAREFGENTRGSLAEPS